MMNDETTPRNNRTPRGRVSFDVQRNGKEVTVHLDRQGFRRLLETLEKLAETGERQTFDKSGRNRRKSVSAESSNEDRTEISKLIFHIDAER
jgi:hypothetical protein